MSATEKTLRELLDEERNETLRSNMYAASSNDPDAAARAQTLASETGVPADVAQRNRDELERRARFESIGDAAQLRATSPALARFMENRENADVAIDDTDTLASLEMTARQPLLERAGRKFARNANDAIGNMIEFAGWVEQYSLTGLAKDYIARRVGVKEPSQAMQDIGKTISEDYAEYWKPETYYDIDRLLDDPSFQNLAGLIVEEGIASAPYSLLAMASPALLATSLGQGIAEERATNDKRSEVTAMDRFIGVSVAVPLAYMEKFGIEKLLKRRVPKKSGDGADKPGTLLGDIARAGAREAGLEFVQESIEYTAGTLGTEAGFEASDALKAGLTGAIVGGGTGAGIRGVTAIDQALEKRTDRDVRRLLQGTLDHAKLDAQIELAQSSRLNGRAADKFKQYVDEIAADQMIFVDPMRVNEAIDSGVVVTPEVKQMARNRTLSGDMAIPLRDFLQNPELAIALRESVRLRPDGPTQAEMTLDEDGSVKRLIERASKNTEAKATADRIYDEVKDQLRVTGRLNDNEARLSAQIIPAYAVTAAERFGISVEDVYRAMNFRIAGPSTPTDYVPMGTFTPEQQVLLEDSDIGGPGGVSMTDIRENLPEQFGEFEARLTESGVTPGEARVMDQPGAEAFNRWFGDSKVVDENGEPLVVYHGSALEGYTTTTDIESFDLDKIGDRWGADQKGFFFTNSKNFASTYASSDRDYRIKGSGQGVVYPVYVSLQNPLIVDAEFLKSQKMDEIGVNEDSISFWDNYQSLIFDWIGDEDYDGVILRDEVNQINGGPTQTVVAFRPEQIKSAIGNRGTFDPNDPNILNQEQRDGYVERAIQDAISREYGSTVDTVAYAGGTVAVSESTPRWNGKPQQPDAVSAVGVHYSRSAGITALEGERAGTGFAGTERQRLGSGQFGLNGGLSRQINFYVQSETGVLPLREAVVKADQPYKVVLTNLYDVESDPRGLARNTNSQDEFEAAIAEAGFDGYMIAPFGTHREPVALVIDVDSVPVADASADVMSDEATAPVVSETLFDTILNDRSVSAGRLSPDRWLERLGAYRDQLPAEINIGNKPMYLNQFLEQVLTDEQRTATYASSAGAEAGRLRLAERVRRSLGVLPDADASATRREADGSLRGLPRIRNASVFKPAVDVARQYMADQGLTYDPPSTYAEVDPERAKRIADAFDAMEHNPSDPEVKAAYDAMITETLAQYEAVIASGLTVEFIAGDDPYAGNPRLMIEDVRENNHMWVFGTRDGFGSNAEFDVSDNPLLAETEFEISGQKALANDLFRVVHDYFGHVKEGVGFRAGGEENAWRAHAAMYSPLARRAVTTETRGQNSWVNYGPQSEFNRTASAADTIYADQKLGLLPEWASEEGINDVRYEQSNRGNIELTDTSALIKLGPKSDPSTFLHEAAHLFLETERRLVAQYGMNDVSRGLLKWIGKESLDQVTREDHEKFAETFEAYLREGKAPSLGLRDAFAAFSRWLKRLYASLSGLSRQQLGPEISDIMDRLLATEAEIEEAASAPLYDQYFRSKEQAGMSDAQWRDYQEKISKVRTTAELTVDEKIVKELKRRRDKEWKALKEPMYEEELERLSKTPVYQIISDLNDPNGKLDIAAVREVLGIEQMTGRLIGKAKRDGVDPAEYAEVYGYTSVRKMLVDVLNAPSLKDAANEAAEARMVAKHGQMTTDEEIEREAQEALHNDAQADVLLTEIRALNRGAPEINRKYLEAQAKRLIASMKYKDIQPNKFYRAEIKAAQDSVRAGNDTEAAREAKIRQLSNHYLYREATAVKQRMDSNRRYVRGMQTRKFDTKLVDPSYAQNIAMLANLYDVRKKSRDQAKLDVDSLINWYRTQIADPNQFSLLELLDPTLVLALDARDRGQFNTFEVPTFDDMTADDLQGVVDMLRHLRFVGGTNSELGRAEFQAQKQELIDNIIAKGGKDKPEQFESGKWHELTNSVKLFFNRLPSVRNMMRVLDGFDDVDDVARRLIYDELSAGEFERLQMTRELYEQYERTMRDVSNLGISKGQWTKRSITRENGREWSLTSEGRFMLAMYWGTESSREAIRAAWDVTDNDVQRMLALMTPEQLRLVNATWEVNESLWPRLSAASTRMYGASPEKLEPTPFVVNGVQMTGGHMRLYYDSVEVELKSDQEQGQNFGSVTPTKAGSLHSRVGSGGRRVSLDKNNVIRATDEAIHFIAFAERARKIAGLINSHEVKAAIIQKHGEPFYQALIETVQGLTGNRTDEVRSVSTRFFIYVSRMMRRAATAKHLMWSVRNSVQQFTSIPVAMSEVGVGPYIMHSGTMVPALIEDLISGKSERIEFVDSRSEFMRNRKQLINREAREFLKNVSTGSKVEQVWNTFARAGFTPQTVIDSVIAYPVWMAKYEQSMNLHNDEKRAAIDADTAVGEAVGSGSDLHLGGMFQANNSEFIKMMTLFGSWFSSYYQRLYRSSKGGTDFTNREFIVTATVVPMTIAVTSAMLIMDTPGEDDDPWMHYFTRYLAFMGGTIPIVRDFAGAFAGFTPKTPAAAAIELPARLYKEGEQAALDKQTVAEGAADIAGVVTNVVPIPGSGQVLRLVNTWESAEQGNEELEGLPLMYQALVEGPDRND